MASYRQAIKWMARNDDTEWVLDEPLSVTAALIADLFGKTDEQVRCDLIKALEKEARASLVTAGRDRHLIRARKQQT